MRECPFCGYDEGWTKEATYQKPIKYRVECNVCGAIGPEAKTSEMAEEKWDGLLAKIQDKNKFQEALDEEAMGGVSAPMATLQNTPGVGNATPAAAADMTAVGSGDKWGDGPIYDQKGKLETKKKKSKKKKKVIKENNLNPYDKIGAMMAKKMGTPQVFKQGDSVTNTVKQEHFKESPEPNFKIPTFDQYQKDSKDKPKKKKKKKVNEEEMRDEQALKDVRAKEELEKLGIAYEFKPAKSGKNRTFIKTPMKELLELIGKSEWEDAGKNPENTLRKYIKGDQVLAIFADGKDLPRATVTAVKKSKDEEPSLESVVIRKVVSNSLNPYIKN